MANKTYNEFDPGTYDPEKIFLQADPTSGTLEKVVLSQVTNFFIWFGQIEWDSGTSTISLNQYFSNAGTASIVAFGTATFQITGTSGFLFPKTVCLTTMEITTGASSFLLAGLEDDDTIDITHLNAAGAGDGSAFKANLLIVCSKT